MRGYYIFDANSYEIYKSRRWGDCTFARASPVSLSRKPFSLDIEATPKTDLSLSVSLVHRQTWRLTGLKSWLHVMSVNIGEVGATPKLLSLGIKKMGKETPGIISNDVFWKPGQLYFKHTKHFPEIFFRLGAGAKNTKNCDFSALPRNCG